MPKFIFAYHGGSAPETEEDGQQVMARWVAWFDDLGSVIVDGGNPVGISRTVSAHGVEEHGGANPISGYSIIEAESIDEACVLASGCPILDDDGSVEVAEIHEMTEADMNTRPEPSHFH